MNGLLILVDLTQSSERESRLFRNRRLKLEKRTKLESIKKGIYIIPFADSTPSKKERRLLFVLLGLIQRCNGKARCFHVKEFEPSTAFTNLEESKWVLKSEGEADLGSIGLDQNAKL